MGQPLQTPNTIFSASTEAQNYRPRSLKMSEAVMDAKAPFDVMDVPGGAHVKMWTRGVPVDEKARVQLSKAAAMPFVFKHVAAMRC